MPWCRVVVDLCGGFSRNIFVSFLGIWYRFALLNRGFAACLRRCDVMSHGAVLVTILLKIRYNDPTSSSKNPRYISLTTSNTTPSLHTPPHNTPHTTTIPHTTPPTFFTPTHHTTTPATHLHHHTPPHTTVIMQGLWCAGGVHHYLSRQSDVPARSIAH